MNLKKTRQTGFTLIEVLVATVIMAVGLLGIVSMHGSAMYFTKDSESQWVASDAVFKVFDVMRTRLNGQLNNFQGNRAAKAQQEMAAFVNATSGTLAATCPNTITTMQQELQCIQRDVAAALPGGRIESITVPTGAVAQGVAVQVSWLASFASKDAARECAALAAVTTEVSAADASINAGISAGTASDCNSGDGNVRRVVTWVMVP